MKNLAREAQSRRSGGARSASIESFPAREALSICPRPRGRPRSRTTAVSLGADALHVADLAQLRSAMVAARAASKTQVLVIDTTHERTTGDGGCWWDVAVPEVSSRAEVGAARAAYEAARKERQP